jgi:hypothetical protein
MEWLDVASLTVTSPIVAVNSRIFLDTMTHRMVARSRMLRGIIRDGLITNATLEMEAVKSTNAW